MLLEDKSIEQRNNLIRIYVKNLFSHIIGQIDEDNNGISGLEMSFDDNKSSTNPLMLTVDTDIQFIIRNELIKFNKVLIQKVVQRF